IVSSSRAYAKNPLPERLTRLILKPDPGQRCPTPDFSRLALQVRHQERIALVTTHPPPRRQPPGATADAAAPAPIRCTRVPSLLPGHDLAAGTCPAHEGLTVEVAEVTPEAAAAGSGLAGSGLAESGLAASDSRSNSGGAQMDVDAAPANQA